MTAVNFDRLRELMVERQIIARGIKDEQVISALREIPRHKFVPEDLQNDSYEDYPLSIGNGQTISQPYIVALMTEGLGLSAEDKVLEIGTGSGYQAAILARLSAHVYTVERIEVLLERAKEIFKDLGITNISTKLGDGTLGWEEFSPYQAIIVTAASDNVPPPLVKQLNEGGRLVIPLGGSFTQALTLIEKKEGGLKEEQICGCAFVPLLGKYGARR